MILVTVGASHFPFDRLLRAVDGLSTTEELVVQHGPSLVRPAGARCVEFMSFDKVSTLVQEARVVVTHAGVGSILLSLTHGKRPVVVPRLRSFGETVDDHQAECARRFDRTGLVTLVEDPEGLALAVAGNGAAAEPTRGEEVSLVDDLRAYLESLLGQPETMAGR
jgi:UDP-N-acetylglucosamine transferase subunit ALG13